MKLYIETLGCPKNFNDSEGIAGIWTKAGMDMAESLDEADVILVNTCGFINDAKTESIERIFDMARFIEEDRGTLKNELSASEVGKLDLEKCMPPLKEGTSNEKAHKKLLIVSGCLSQRYGNDLFDEMPEVDIFLGVNDYEKLPQMVRAYRSGERRRLFSCHPKTFEEFSARRIDENPYTATLRIAEGCNNCCAYCVIPQIRGAYRSRPMENILTEASELAERGCKEVILIAQDVTEYGRDLYGRLALPELLRELCKVAGIKWIRLMYCYEDKITDELIEVMASEEKVCNYIDIPLQHISNKVLDRMNRHSTKESITETIGRLRSAIPDIHIRTTMIVGFPGESEEDFEELLDFVEETRFERLGVFAYSREEGTVAGDMENQIDDEIKSLRADAVMRRQVDISREINEAKPGNTMTVLVDGKDESGAYIGRTMYDAPEIDNTVIFDADIELVSGDMVKVRITDAFDYDLVGRMEE